MKLNLGCGDDLREGYTNLDLYNTNADIIWDLTKFPYPFDDDTFDYIFSKHVLEHLWVDNVRVFDELMRISKPGGVVHLLLPYYNSEGAAGFAHAKHGYSLIGFLPQHDFFYTHGTPKEIYRKAHPSKIGKWIPNWPKLLRGYGPRECLSLLIGDIIEQVEFKYKITK